MSNSNLLEAISHSFLVATSSFCLYEVKDAHHPCLYICYGLLIINNLLGVQWWASNYNYTICRLFSFTAYCQLLFVLPCITTEVWLQHGFSKEWSYAWIVVPIFPLICYIADANFDIPLDDIHVVCNLMGLGGLCITKHIKLGIAAAICYGLAHVNSRQMALHNYMLCFFAYFAMRTLGLGVDIFA